MEGRQSSLKVRGGVKETAEGLRGEENPRKISFRGVGQELRKKKKERSPIGMRLLPSKPLERSKRKQIISREGRKEKRAGKFDSANIPRLVGGAEVTANWVQGKKSVEIKKGNGTFG